MASINTFLQNIQTAVYGEEVRTAIHDSISAINDENVTVLVSANAAKDAAEAAAQSAETNKTLAEADINNFVAQWAQWFSTSKDGADDQVTTMLNQLIADKQGEFYTWLNSLQAVLSGDVATNLTNAVVDLQTIIETLADEQIIYRAIEDSDGTAVTDSYSTSVQGKIVYKIA
jgi:hypothetical protein